MPARINGYTMTTMEGEIPSYANRVESRERAGVDGYTHMRLGKRSETFSLKTSTLALTLASARSLAADYESLAATFAAIETTDGRHFGRVLVHRVQSTVRKLLLSTDGSTAIVDTTWTLQRGA